MNPFLPIKKPKIAIVDFRADESVFEAIRAYNIKPIKTIKCDELLQPVCGHPDMVLHPIDNENIVAAPNVYDYYHDILSDSGINVIKGGKALSRNYPNDIAYNVARISNYAIHNTKYTDEILKYYLQKSGIDFIHVNQGYAKCSTACLSDNMAITSDIMIYNTIIGLGIDCLYINPENIKLEGFNYGFIGGCMGALTSDVFMLTGKPIVNEQYEGLYSCIKSNGYKLVIASNNVLTDLGTIIVL